MKTILDEIVLNKRKEVNVLKEKYKISDFEKSIFFNRKCHSISKAIMNNSFGLIAEIKRKSPSAGNLFPDLNIEKMAKHYKEIGAIAISCLTDEMYFGGTVNDVITLRKVCDLPILRKEFIIDEIQIFESKAIGADAILLIAEVLSFDEAVGFTIIAQSLGMEVIMEFHEANQLSKINELINVIGINNRNLKIQKTSLETSKSLIDFLPKNKVLISESGIKTAEELEMLKSIGFNGALVGESLLKVAALKEYNIY